jgi:hypothetical protein
MSRGLELLPEAWRTPEFLHAREIPGRGLCAVQRFIYTCGLMVDVSFDGRFAYDYKARFCYPSAVDAIAALVTWGGEGDPPGEWIKEKVTGRSRTRRIGGD